MGFIRVLSVFLCLSLVLPVAQGASGSRKTDYRITWYSVPENTLEFQSYDWSTFEENLQALGYSENQIGTKVGALRAGPTTTTDIQNALGGDHPFSGRIRQADHLTLAESHLGERIVDQLGPWTMVPGFKPALYLEEWISTTNATENHLQALMGWSHLWVKSKHAMAIAQQLWEDVPKPEVAAWLLANLRGENRAKLGRKIKRTLDWEGSPQSFVQMVHYIPKEFQAVALKRELFREWYQDKKFPPVVLDGITIVSHGSFHAGACPMMWMGHTESLGISAAGKEPADWRNTVLVAVGETIVGALKKTGDPSMVALRNVVNSKGEPVLCMGGIYHLPIGLVSSLEAADFRAKTWHGVSVDELAVKPATFLLNESAWPGLDDTLREITEAVLNKREKTKLENVQRGQSIYDDSFSKIREKVWSEVLNRIDCARQLLEKPQK